MSTSNTTTTTTTTITTTTTSYLNLSDSDSVLSDPPSDLDLDSSESEQESTSSQQTSDIPSSSSSSSHDVKQLNNKTEEEANCLKSTDFENLVSEITKKISQDKALTKTNMQTTTLATLSSTYLRTFLSHMDPFIADAAVESFLASSHSSGIYTEMQQQIDNLQNKLTSIISEMQAWKSAYWDVMLGVKCGLEEIERRKKDATTQTSGNEEESRSIFYDGPAGGDLDYERRGRSKLRKEEEEEEEEEKVLRTIEKEEEEKVLRTIEKEEEEKKKRKRSNMESSEGEEYYFDEDEVEFKKRKITKEVKDRVEVVGKGGME